MGDERKETQGALGGSGKAASGKSTLKSNIAVRPRTMIMTAKLFRRNNRASIRRGSGECQAQEKEKKRSAHYKEITPSTPPRDAADQRPKIRQAQREVAHYILWCGILG